MIPDIGLMVGSYIIVRLVSFLTRTGIKQESIIVKVLSVFAVGITIVCIADLCVTGYPGTN